jgi:hypothetical protein
LIQTAHNSLEPDFETRECFNRFTCSDPGVWI